MVIKVYFLRGRHSTVGFPVKYWGQLQTGLCLATEQNAPMPHDLRSMHGFMQREFSQALSKVQSSSV